MSQEKPSPNGDPPSRPPNLPIPSLKGRLQDRRRPATPFQRTRRAPKRNALLP